ncbi:hypothetical protein PFMC_05944, partial [Plasmodium falciparum CAMP/Malaysia]
MFDRIGKDVHDQVKNGADAKKYIKELEGTLSQVSINLESAYTTDPCELDYTKHTTSAKGNAKPCGNDGNDVKRFSDKEGAECTKSKIKDSNNYCGACAPYRRLSLCNKNMEKIATSTTKHDLLAEVCMAAKYEGQTIARDYPQYQEKYGDTGHTTCTMLARSFADIGDIVRGRDLYLGNKKKKQTERDELENKLKEIFKEIHEGLSKNGAQTYYNDNGGNFFKLREDWWTANRETVWKALTCDEDKKLSNASYFHATCSDGKSQYQTQNQCRCTKSSGANAGKANDNVNIVPTYFDYVPQFLRWFEEWAEDFCRKKKKKVENLEKSCRGTDASNEPRYCSRNGCDCTKTVRAKGKLRYGNRCTDCLFACHRYENWIEKQKEQFLKQKQRYENVINGTSSSSGSRKKRATSTTNYNGYEKKFYDELKAGGYNDVGKFLNLLNNEKECKEVKDGGTIDFAQEHGDNSNDKTKGTFYRSEYCQPCPYCGVKRTKNGGKKWEEKKKNDQCTSGKLYEPRDDKEGTKIEILKSGEGKEDIKNKIEKFCQTQNGSDGGGGGGVAGGVANGSVSNSDSKELYDEWKCYEFKELREVVKDQDEEEEEEDEVKNAGGLCILPNPKKNKEEGGNTSEKEPDKIQKTYNDFFYYWVAHMLKDSIYWETQKLEKCLKNGTKTRCKNNYKCKTDCDCFQNWIKQKKEQEWTKIKEHFKTQEGLDKKGESGEQKMLSGVMTPDFVLKYVLKLEFSKENSTEDAKNNVSAEEIDLINKMLKEDEKEQEEVDGADNEENNPIDKLLKHEKKIAKDCQSKHNKCPPKPQDTDAGRSLRPIT